MKPVTRIETYLATAAGDPDAPTTLPEPKTRIEVYLNELCARIADMIPSSWYQVRQKVRNGTAANVFYITDQLSCQRGDDTLVWDVIGIDHDTPTDPQFTHSMTLQLHNCFQTTMQFDAPEAFYYAENGLEAGTYHFAIDSAYDAPYNDLTSYQFTLAQAVPAGGQLTFPWTGYVNASTIKVNSYASATSTTPVEQVAVSEGADGTNIGTLTEAGDFANNLNSIDRVRYGSNNYKESAIRQWLNSRAAAGSVWTPQTNFDRPPSWATNTAGFMYGMDADFLAVIGKTHLVVARNTVCDGGGFDEMDDYFFLLSRSEVYGGTEVSGVNEGEPYPYYANYSALSAAGVGADSNRIKYRNNSAQLWFLRTPNSDASHLVRGVRSMGDIGNAVVRYDFGVAAACCII